MAENVAGLTSDDALVRPLPAFGALIGYIIMANGQNTQAFFIVSQQTFSAPANGRLFLMVNDDDNRDNNGSFRVRIVY